MTIKIFVFYGSYFVFPALVIFWFMLFGEKRWVKLLGALGFVLCVVFIYARFIEPRILLIKSHDLILQENGTPIKAVVFADTHNGHLFRNTVSLDRVIDQVNGLRPDLVIIPGDFVYHIDVEEMDTVLASLQKLSAPAYAVTGNHDVGKPGPDVGDELRDTLGRFGIEVIDNRVESIKIKGERIFMLGLSDIWEGKTDYSVIDTVATDDLVFGLAHNPDTAYEIEQTEKIDVLFSGHTHGGQVRLPVLYKWAIPTKYDFDQGLYDIHGMNVFVTPGVGMVGLPFRFLMPPRIDVVNLKI